jgi:hypothetical protein
LYGKHINSEWLPCLIKKKEATRNILIASFLQVSEKLVFNTHFIK